MQMKQEAKHNTKDEQNDSGGCLGIIVFLIVFIVAGIWIFNKVQDWYYNREQLPFWKGTERIQVCKPPYYSSDQCYYLTVSLVDNKTAKINFKNGGHIITRNLTCYWAGNTNAGQGYKFYRSWDSDGAQWDFLPAFIVYPALSEN
jgi:hypothetical protein